ncbi:molybdate ABC transporter substrate-binding protein [Oceanidesulfovibrio marinus]|uniref:Molybdate ABC transporter substrate-binding protein n=1 Tax=Oceanidesulfovibrio marinus TaxID=370038 RepID=A0A6P1ZBT7_9BACT|nr:molybdate ABC transporter substrate-binding protein [Oceanidesulfovibrio marinus]TVM31568.1 molybdate ABC transporter substrate-binding protein [Oceanidesulfovibrio marinus]
MKKLATLVLACLVLFGATQLARADDSLTIAAGAGYKKLVTALGKAFTAETSIETQQIYGNMGQVTAQAQNSGVVDTVIGDKRYLDGSDLPFSTEYVIGKGKLVLAVAKGVSLPAVFDLKVLDAESAPKVLTDPAVTRIAHPDAKKAIYGRAATQFLANTGLAEQLEPKLIEVGTVPQVSAYVVNGEVDLGFINLTDGYAIQDRAARIIPVDEALYEPITIVAKTLNGCPSPDIAKRFGEFLQTDTARAIATEHGL